MSWFTDITKDLTDIVGDVHTRVQQLQQPQSGDASVATDTTADAAGNGGDTGGADGPSVMDSIFTSLALGNNGPESSNAFMDGMMGNDPSPIAIDDSDDDALIGDAAIGNNIGDIPPEQQLIQSAELSDIETSPTPPPPSAPVETDADADAPVAADVSTGSAPAPTENEVKSASAEPQPIVEPTAQITEPSSSIPASTVADRSQSPSAPKLTSAPAEEQKLEPEPVTDEIESKSSPVTAVASSTEAESRPEAPKQSPAAPSVSIEESEQYRQLLSELQATKRKNAKNAQTSEKLKILNDALKKNIREMADSHQTELSELRSELEQSAQQSDTTKDEQITALTRQIKDYQTDNQMQTRQISDLTQECSLLQKQISDATQESDILQSKHEQQMQSLRDTITKLQQDLQTKNDEIDGQNVKMSQLLDIQSATNEENKAVMNQLSVLKSEHSITISNLNEKVATLGKQLSDSSADAQTSTAIVSEMKPLSEYKVLEQSHSQLGQQLISLRNDHEQTITQMKSEFESEKGGLLREIEQLKINASVVAAAPSIPSDEGVSEGAPAIEKTGDDSVSAMLANELQTKLSAKEGEYQELYRQMATLNSQLSSYQEQAMTFQNTIASQKSQSEQEIATLKRNIETREKQLEKYAINHQQLQSEYQQTQSKVVTFKQQISEKDNKIRSLSSQITTLSSQTQGNADLNKVLSQKAKELEEVMKEGQEWASQCHDLEKKVRQLRQMITAKDEDAKEVKAGVQSKEDRITNLLESLQKKNEDSDSVVERNKLLTTHNDDLKYQLAQSSQEMGNSRDKIRALESERDDYVVMIQDKDKEIAKLQVQVRDAVQSRERMQTSAVKEQAILKELQELRDEMVRSAERSGQKHERLGKERDEERLLRQEAEARNEQLSAEIPSATRPLLRQIESLRSAHSHKENIWTSVEKSIRARIRELEKELSKTSTVKSKYENETEDLRISQSKLSIQISSYKQENKDLKGKLDESTDKLENLEIKYEDLQHEFNLFKQRTQRLDVEKKSLEEQLHQVYRDHEEERNKLQSSLTSERHKKESLEKTMSIMQQKLHQFENYSTHRRHSNATPTGATATGSADEPSSLLLNTLFTGENQSRGDNSPTEERRQSSSHNMSIATAADMWSISRYRNEIRQKDNEMDALKQRLHYLQNNNDTLSDEIVKLKSGYETLLKYEQSSKQLRSDVRQLQLRYEAAVDVILQKETQIKKLSAIATQL